MATEAAYIDLVEGAAPATPGTGIVRVYAKTDALAYQKDDAGTETGLAGGGGSAVATDAIWDAAGDLAVGSGANTAARLAIGAAGGAVSRINGVVAWNSGTGFPTAVTGDRFWRTDLGMEFYYDGTRWVTTTLYTQSFVGDTVASAAGWSASDTLRAPHPHPTLDIWIVSFWAATYTVTTSSGSQYWTLVLNGVTGASLSTINNSANALVQETAAVGQVKAAAGWVQLDLTKVSTAGNLYATPAFSYRIISA